MTGDTSQTAVASSSTPKAFFTTSIHGPLCGRALLGGGADDQERHAHAERHDEQRDDTLSTASPVCLM